MLVELTAYHAKYIAYDLTRSNSGGPDRLSMALFDAAVDLNPHQIEAALFALHSPLAKGVLLADEVGLGKTIEAGIVLCQLWAERKRSLLVLCPASLRKQWALELESKFNLPTCVLEAKTWRDLVRQGINPLEQRRVLIASLPFASRFRNEIRAASWHLVVIDEAHKLRNAWKPNSKIAQAIRWATEDVRKLLLTATPLQNSLLELFGLASLIDPHLFGDVDVFRDRYMGAGADLAELRERLTTFCRRTLRNQVTEYVRYTERHSMTQPFRPTDDEHGLYEAVSRFLQREDSYALPARQRHLTALILRKLLASSSRAIAATLDTLRTRLVRLRDERAEPQEELAEILVAEEELEDEWLEELLDEEVVEDPAHRMIDRKELQSEIDELGRLTQWAQQIQTDTKTQCLLSALAVGLTRMAATGAAQKALIFTESRRTQEYLKSFLEASGFAGQVALFHGGSAGPDGEAILNAWIAANQHNGRVSGARAVDYRTALVEHFRDQATILIATEAAAEGLNLQFCSLVINYDLPWNPQRIEQRIGRCHRYGQTHDVVVVNFLNERNDVDRRVLQLLASKFSLFSGVFGASDSVLGSIESGIDFERRVLDIYQLCRTPAEIDAAFEKLQRELEDQIRNRLDNVQQALLEHFDEDVHERLRLRLTDARSRLDRFGRRFWQLSAFQLADRAQFDHAALAFALKAPPERHILPGRYHLISKTTPDAYEPEGPQQFLYRLSHPLGEWVVDTAKRALTPLVQLSFDVTGHATRVAAVEALVGRSGWLSLTLLGIESYEQADYLLFSGITDTGETLDQETMEKLLGVGGTLAGTAHIPPEVQDRLNAEGSRHISATLSRSLEENSTHFRQAREKLERWSEDVLAASERALVTTKERLKAARRLARLAATLEEQRASAVRIAELERVQRKQRQEIFQVEDEISVRRDQLIDELERRLKHKTEIKELFTIRWSVV